MLCCAVLWHRRTAHLSYGGQAKMADSKMVRRQPVSGASFDLEFPRWGGGWSGVGKEVYVVGREEADCGEDVWQL